MRRALVALIAGFVVAVGCTQDFGTFSVGGNDSGNAASGGSGGTTADATAGAAGVDASADGTAGQAGTADDASDAPSDAPTDVPFDVNCSAGTKQCGSSCVLETNPSFGCAETTCSPCNIPHASAVCDSQGKCAIAQCDGGFADCDGQLGNGCETHTDADPANCGGCSASCITPNASAKCTSGTCAIDQCDAGYTDCNGDVTDGCERNTSDDPTACGSCTNDCTATAGNWTCSSGQCTVSQCPTGMADCDHSSSNGCETDTTTSTLHCGYCGHACNLPNATAKCTGSVCAIDQCKPGFADCDGNPANGCEAELAKDTTNCGACLRACSTSGVLTASCSGGVCTSTCQANFANCSQPATGPDDGCEANLLTSPDHCGSCTRACSSSHTAQVACSGGRCTSTCQSGWGNCTQPVAPGTDDGCETNTATGTANCGACGHSCLAIHASSTQCISGSCKPACDSTYADCTTPPSGSLDNGCETAVGSDPDNCGACGRTCSSANVASRSCALGVCDSFCNANYANCNQPATGADDGCETNTTTDPAHCGTCDRACSTDHTASLQCAGGVCTSTCQAGYGNCSKPGAPTVDDGCETNTQTTTTACGACGHACSTNHASSTSCSGGKCAPSCQANFADCATPTAPAADDGCEGDLLNNPLTCGACNRACGTSNAEARVCSSGVCTSSCDLGYENCSTPAAPTADNACETASSNTSCGGCGNDCTKQGLTCAGSLCGCTSKSQCGNNSDCTGGVCICHRLTSSSTCKHGETCGGIPNDCQCNGGNNCSGSEVCCRSGGCKNVATDAANCGACGRACAPGFVCAAGACACDAAADCNAGSAGTCSAGVCKCGSTTCAVGERCLSDGSCG